MGKRLAVTVELEGTNADELAEMLKGISSRAGWSNKMAVRYVSDQVRTADGVKVVMIGFQLPTTKDDGSKLVEILKQLVQERLPGRQINIRAGKPFEINEHN